MNNINLASHPLIEHKLAILRDKNTKPFHFRMLIDEITSYLLYESTKDLTLKEVNINTPIIKTKAKKINQKIMICPILRAALGMLDSVFKLIPDASVGFLGFARDEQTLESKLYFQKLPKDASSRVAIIIDPMFATGSTAINACDLLKKYGVKDIKFISLVASPIGLENFNKFHKDVKIYVASIDECLNENGYIVPGLGDAGDRVFNTL